MKLQIRAFQLDLCKTGQLIAVGYLIKDMRLVSSRKREHLQDFAILLAMFIGLS